MPSGFSVRSWWPPCRWPSMRGVCRWPRRPFAVAAMPLWFAVHVVSGFARAERLAEGGSEGVPEQEIKRFVRLNLPIHSGYAAVYVVADLWLLAGLL